MKKLLTVLTLAFLVIGMYSCNGNYKKGTMLPIPTFKQMTPDEREFSQDLFSGDTMVRIRLENGDTILAAVTVKRWKENNPAVEVTNEHNGGMYLVRE